jgi:hypothetical protein
MSTFPHECLLWKMSANGPVCSVRNASQTSSFSQSDLARQYLFLLSDLLVDPGQPLRECCLGRTAKSSAEEKGLCMD